MRYQSFLPMIACFFVLLACDEEKGNPQPDYKHIALTGQDKQLVEANNAFGFDLLQQLAATEEAPENLLVSPLSISYALGMAYNGTNGTTNDEMAQCLHWEDMAADDLNKSFGYLPGALQNADKHVVMDIANAIWYREVFHVEDDFVATSQEYFDATVSPLDFSDPAAPQVINQWVADKTHGKVDEIVKNIPAEAFMYLVNAIYFSGTWTYSFDPAHTADRTFFLKDGSETQVPSMQLETSLYHFANEDCAGIELPYSSGNFSMALLLPHAGFSPRQLAAQLGPRYWKNLLANGDTTSVKLQMPKFTFAYEKTLKTPLQNLGMQQAFSPAADFSKIRPQKDIFISEVKHKSFIEVTEVGTEAAAVTSVEMVFTSVDEESPVSFYLNRPFLFAIHERSTGTILFIGIVENPV